jgi:hypothetical protein
MYSAGYYYMNALKPQRYPFLGRPMPRIWPNQATMRVREDPRARYMTAAWRVVETLSILTHLEGIATSSASVREVVVGRPPGWGPAVMAFPLLPEELRLGNAARKSAISSSGGFCEFLQAARQQWNWQLYRRNWSGGQRACDDVWCSSEA